MICDKRSKVQHRGMIAILIYLLVWFVAIAYAGTETTTSTVNIAILLFLVGIINALVGYIFVSNIRDVKSGQRESHKEMSETIKEVFRQLDKKRDKDDCTILHGKVNGK